MSSSQREQKQQYNQQYYEQNKDKLNARRLENHHKQKEKEDLEFMQMWMNTLDQQITDIRDSISKLDENDPEFDVKLSKAMAWAQVLATAKGLRDGVDVSSILKNVPQEYRI